MKQLEKLIIEAQTITELEAEVERVMQACNACRYCEDFCAVFPVMIQRLKFGKADINYLANLCHNCSACLHTCQYAPPHEFAINVPKAVTEVRLETYQHYAQPAALGASYRCVGVTVTLTLVFGLILSLFFAIGLKGSLFHPLLAGDFYQIFPYNLLAWMLSSVLVPAVGLLTTGVTRFQREISPGMPCSVEIAEASRNALTLKYLDGGHGKGCNGADGAFTLMCRCLHYFTFYGFLLCFVATVVAAGYHYLVGIEAPYLFFSVPVMLGMLGDISLVVGPAGLLWLNLRRSPLHGDARQKPMGHGFILLLLLTSLTGLAPLAGRDISWTAILLAIHLGVVMALFPTISYGKLVHGFYRYAVLLKWAIEKRRGRQTGASGDQPANSYPYKHYDKTAEQIQ